MKTLDYLAEGQQGWKQTIGRVGQTIACYVNLIKPHVTVLLLGTTVASMAIATGGLPGALRVLAVYPRARSGDSASSPGEVAKANDDGLLSRRGLLWALAGFWYFAALLQAQPYWWQPGQFAGTLNNLVGLGGLNSVLVDPVVAQLSSASATIEVPLNIALIIVFLALGVGLSVSREGELRPFLIASIVVSVVVWYCAEALGMILTGMATDFNSGLLLVVLTLACWPRVPHLRVARIRYAEEMDTLAGPAAPAPQMQSKSV